MKKLLVGITTALMMIGSTSVFANTSDNYADTNLKTEVNYNISSIEPISEIDDTLLRGTSIPSSIWNSSSQGKYTFSGTSTSQTLYTNNKFTGKTSYKTSVSNTSSYPLTVQVKTLTKTYATHTINPYTTLTFTALGMSASDNIYIRFTGNYQNFSGYIE